VRQIRKKPQVAGGRFLFILGPMRPPLVTTFPIEFPSGSTLLNGRFYRDTAALDARQPVIIVTGSWLTVQDQMATTYARRLAAHGFTTLTFDFAGFGRSGGAPRQMEMPTRKIADIIAAAEFASTLSLTEGVGHLAVCASAQYVAAAIARGARIQAFASVAGWFHDAVTVAPFYGGAHGVARRLQRAVRAVEHFKATGEVDMVPAYQKGNQEAAMFLDLDYYANPTRGAIPAWTNQMAAMSWQHWLLFDGLRHARALTVPTLFVHGDGCVFPDNVREIYASLPAAKTLVWTDGFQVDFYDQQHLVEPAVAAAAKHFDATLRRPGHVAH
jgi:uncharacterized protein